MKLPVNNKDTLAKDDDGYVTVDGKQQYEYETILAKILNEKKLALASSPEVIRFLFNVNRTMKRASPADNPPKRHMTR